MEEHDFPLQPAYEFLRSKRLANDASAIREAKFGSNDKIMKRASLVAVLAENDLLESFLARNWPKATVPEGRPEIEWLKKVHERYQKSRALTCEQIEGAIRRHDSDPRLTGDEAAFRKALEAARKLPPLLGRFVAEVWVVADWGSIEFFPFTDRFAMAEEIERVQSLLSPIRSLDGWDAETKGLLRVVDELARSTALLPRDGDGRSQLSFLSKYLHFCVSDAFAIWDSNARLVLGGDDAATWESYKKWIVQVRAEVAKHRECLERLKTPVESLVRTLDKALYTIGREIVSEK
jgi:hypothetical protein